MKETWRDAVALNTRQEKRIEKQRQQVARHVSAALFVILLAAELLAEPRLGFINLCVVEDFHVSVPNEPKHFATNAEPFNIGDERNFLEVRHMSHTELRVVPEGTEFVTFILIANVVEETYLVELFNRFLNGGDQHFFVILGGNFVLRVKAYATFGQFLNQFNGHR